MSTGKRLAKRSILGTRVCAPLKDGLYHPGVIQATKSEGGDKENVYSVIFEDKTAGEYRSADLIGPGFQNVTSVKLRPGQKVFVTYNGREVTGQVKHHRPQIDEVLLTVEPSQNPHVNQLIDLKKKLEEIRLLESRKSARLQDLDTDYSRLADGQSEARRRASSFSIDVPSQFGSIGGRKRRPSADDDVMDDCMAAMVLMSLSCSPKSPRLPENGVFSHSWASSSSSGAASWTSGGSLPQDSPGRTESPPSPSSSSEGDSRFLLASSSSSSSCSSNNNQRHNHQLAPALHRGPPSQRGQGKRSRCSSPTEDEGIEMDETVGFLDDPEHLTAKPKKTVVFRCTWRSCFEEYKTCEDVERHVRTIHLGKEDTVSDETDLNEDHEEEFYYTEIDVEVPETVQSEQAPSLEEKNPYQINGYLHQHQQQQHQYPRSLEVGDNGNIYPLEEENSQTASSVDDGGDHHMPLSPVLVTDDKRQSPINAFASIYTSSAPTLSHLDMVRPPHEDPEYQRRLLVSVSESPASPINIPHQFQRSISWHAHPYANSAPGVVVSAQKFMRLSPKTVSSSLKASPMHRKGRSESRKCRKVYGMENRDMWCTQCKWKKACTRFSD